MTGTQWGDVRNDAEQVLQPEFLPVLGVVPGAT